MDDQSLNVLRRSTPFTCVPRFRCDIPEPPSDAKMLMAPPQPERLARFALTSLERNPRQELVLEPGLGIHVGLADTSPYSVTDEAAQLAPEDLELLEGDTPLSPESRGPRKPVRERLRGSKAELSWLMRTTYISNEADGRRAAAAAAAGAQAQRREAAAAEAADPDEAHLQAAEASFAAAQQEPVHATDPSLRPVEVMPVLPDFERWGDNYVLIDFDGDPTADHPATAKLPPAKRQKLAGEAVVKSYALPGGGPPFLAYMVAKDTGEAEAEAVDNDEPRPAPVGEYEWVREYQYDVSNSRETGAAAAYLLSFQQPGVCTFLDLNTRMKCCKRTRGAAGAGAAEGRADFPRPSKLTVALREKTAEERAAAEQRLAALRSSSAAT